MSQLFKKKIDSSLLTDFLKLNCDLLDTLYIFNCDSFKKGLFNGSVVAFLLLCKDYYHTSKHKYLDTKTTFKSFATVLRQLCKFLNMTITSHRIIRVNSGMR